MVRLHRAPGADLGQARQVRNGVCQSRPRFMKQPVTKRVDYRNKMLAAKFRAFGLPFGPTKQKRDSGGRERRFGRQKGESGAGRSKGAAAAVQEA